MDVREIYNFHDYRFLPGCGISALSMNLPKIGVKANRKFMVFSETSAGLSFRSIHRPGPLIISWKETPVNRETIKSVALFLLLLAVLVLVSRFVLPRFGLYT
jgi:hypothetical protein